MALDGESHPADRPSVRGRDVDAPLARVGRILKGICAKAVSAAAVDGEADRLLGEPIAIFGIAPFPTMHDLRGKPVRSEHRAIKIKLPARLDVLDGEGPE